MPSRDLCSTIFRNNPSTFTSRSPSLLTSLQPSNTSTLKKLHIGISNQDGSPTPKVSDFGFASRFQENSQPILFSEFKGTRKGYMAPQIHLTQTTRKPYHADKCDIFALGVILFTLFFNKLPFEYAVQTNKLYQLIIQKKYQDFWNFHSEINRLSLLEDFRAQQFKELFVKMVSFEPSERPSVEQILKEPWLI